MTKRYRITVSKGTMLWIIQHPHYPHKVLSTFPDDALLQHHTGVILNHTGVIYSVQDQPMSTHPDHHWGGSLDIDSVRVARWIQVRDDVKLEDFDITEV